MPDLAELNLIVRSQQVDQARNALGQLVQQAKNAEQSSDRLSRTNQGLESSYGRILAMLGRLVAGYAAWRAAVATVNAVGQSEQTEVAFTTLLKNAELAKKTIADLEKVAAETPFEFRGLANAYRMLLAFKFGLQDIPNMLRIVGDASSALGLGQEGIDRINLALGQMRAKQKVSAQEMNQLAEAGVNAWQYVADAIGVTTKEAMNYAEQGMLDANDTIKAVLAGMDKDFKGGMEKQAHTLLGLFSTLKDTLYFTMRDVGKEVLDAVDFKTWVERSIPALQTLGRVIVDVVRSLAGLPPKYLENQRAVEALVLGLKILAGVVGLLLAFKIVSFVSETSTALMALLQNLLKINGALVSTLLPTLGLITAALVAFAAFEFGTHLANEFKIIAQASAAVDIAFRRAKQSLKDLLDAFDGKKDGNPFAQGNKAGVNALSGTFNPYGAHPMLLRKGAPIPDAPDGKGLDPWAQIAALEKQYQRDIDQQFSQSGGPAGRYQAQGIIGGIEQITAAIKKLFNVVANPPEPPKSTFYDMFSEIKNGSLGGVNPLKGSIEAKQALEQLISSEKQELALARQRADAHEFLNQKMKAQDLAYKAFGVPEGGPAMVLSPERLADVSAKMEQANKKVAEYLDTWKQVQTLQVARKIDEQSRALDQEMLLVGKSNEQREVMVQRMKLENELKDQGVAIDDRVNQMLDQMDEKLRRLQEMRKLETIANDVGQAFSDAMTDFITGAKSAQDAVKGLAMAIERELVQQLVTKPLGDYLAQSIMSGLSGGFNSGYGKAPAGSTAANVDKQLDSFFPNARGNVFLSGSVLAFASGGVVGGPTLFGMNGGRLGLMGEAGPEAILPLTRGSDGRLGVRGGGGHTYNFNYNISTPNADSFRRSKRAMMNDARSIVQQG